jgi:hypothetical protein
VIFHYIQRHSYFDIRQLFGPIWAKSPQRFHSRIVGNVCNRISLLGCGMANLVLRQSRKLWLRSGDSRPLRATTDLVSVGR